MIGARGVIHLVRADVGHPWSCLSKVCIIGCAVSLAYLEYADYTNLRGPGEQFAVPAMLLLLGSMVVGVVDLAREGTRKFPTVAALLIALSIGWFYLLIGIGEVSALIFMSLLWVLDHLSRALGWMPAPPPFSVLVVIVLVVVAVLLLKRR